MTVIYLNLVFLFARGITNVHSTAPGSGILDSERWFSSNLSPQSLSGSSSNPCDGTKDKSGAPDAHLACHNECLALEEELSPIYNVYPDYKTMKYLYDKCGTVIKGKCSTGNRNSAQRAKHALQLDETASIPICWCYSPKESKDWQRNTLFNCRSGIQIMRKFTNAPETVASDISAKSTRTNGRAMGNEAAVEEVAMYLFPSRPPTRPRSERARRPNTSLTGSQSGLDTRFVYSYAGSSVPPPSVPQQQEEDWNTRPDGEPEGKTLCTDVRISGKDVRVLLDTGSGCNIIHPKYQKNMVPVVGGPLYNAGNQPIQILGKTTINLEIRRGVTIPVTGYVIDRKREIILGTDFFVAYAAKVRISDGTMEIFTGQAKVTMTIKLRSTPISVDMMGSRPLNYDPLKISARVNGYATRMVIDTGSQITTVNRSLVKSTQTLRPVAVTCSFGGSNPVGFLGETDISLQIGSLSLTIPALVPGFIPAYTLLTGNDFNKQYFELINYESKLVTLRFPVAEGYGRIETTAFVI